MKAYLIVSGSEEKEEKISAVRAAELIKGLPEGITWSVCPVHVPDSLKTAASILRDAGPDDPILFVPTAETLEWGKRLAAELGRDLCPDTEYLEEIDGELFAVRRVYSTHRKALFPARGTVVLTESRPAGEAGPDLGDVFYHTGTDLQAPWNRIALETRVIPEDLSRAGIVFLGGRGLGSKKNFERMERIAARFGASAACTRPVAANGWAGTEKIVGTSGWKLNAAICIAFGVCGAGPLLRGLEGVGTLIAVNTDPEAPIFDYAAYGIRQDCVRLLDAWETLPDIRK